MSVDERARDDALVQVSVCFSKQLIKSSEFEQKEAEGNVIIQ